MPKIISIIPAVIICCFFSAGCSNKSQKSASQPEKTPDIVASVNGIIITSDDLQFEVEYYNEALAENDPARVTTIAQKSDYLKEEMVQRLMLAQEAEKRGIGKTAEFQRILEKTRQEILAMMLIRQEARAIQANENEARTFYKDYQKKLSELEERHIEEILVDTEKEAQDILFRLLQGEDFSALASAYSKAESRKSSGDAGFVQKGKRSPQFDKVVFSPDLKEGELSSVFSVPEGYSVVRVEEIRQFNGRPFEEVSTEIQQQLLMEKKQLQIQTLLQRLQKESTLEIHEGKIQ